LVWYEIYSGLLKRDAQRQMQRFLELFSIFSWQDYIQADWSLAANLWADRYQQGLPIEDADLLIGAFTRNRNAVLVTNNSVHFQQLGVTIEDWAKSGA